MPTVRPLSPLPIDVPALALLPTPSATAVPVGISLDRRTLFGAGGTSKRDLFRSTNDGTSWSSVRTGFGGTILGVLELDDGEVLVTLDLSSRGELHKSTGWATNPATATFRQVLRTQAGYIRPFWGMHAGSFGDDRVLPGSSAFGCTNEYGVQTTASGSQADKATRVYVTKDYGATWTVAIDLVKRHPGKVNLHFHSVCYDPWWDRLWATYGDANVEGADTLGLLFSDDRGATWEAVKAPAAWAGRDYLQSTPVMAFETHVLVGADNVGGYQRIPRLGYRKAGDVQVNAVMATATGGQIITNGIHRNRRQAGAPILASWQMQQDGHGPGGIIASLDGGETYAEAYRDPLIGQKRTVNVYEVYGPTYNGVVVAQTQAGFQRWEPVHPPAGAFDNTATLTPDGTATVFRVPHGLPHVPASYAAWATAPGMGAFTVSADATDLVFTFAAAPAAAAAVAVGFRFTR